MEQDLNSKINYYIDFSEIYLEEGEKIEEIKIEFGDVKEGFCSDICPYMIMKLSLNLEDNTEIINETILDGYYQEYKLTDEDTVTTIIIKEKDEPKRLPRTGY